MIVLVAVAIAIGAIAFGARLALARRAAPELPAELAGSPQVTVLLPARNEEKNVGELLAALAAQTVPVSIRVIDDGSTDATAAIVESLVARDSRIELLRAPSPPAGESGKVHALAFASAGLGSEWILAIDADARPAPDAIARALAAARRSSLDAISLAARQTVGSPGEALLTPLVFALLDALLGDWRAASEARGAPVANGQFFLLRRAALEAVGGYAAIAREPLDDVALARRLAAGGFRVGFWRARETLHVRMYEGFGASVLGWRRNLALIFASSSGIPIAAAILPWVPAGFALFSLVRGEALAATVAYAGGVVASALARAGTGSSPFWALLHPLDAATLSATLLLGRIDRSRGRLASWRGRELKP